MKVILSTSTGCQRPFLPVVGCVSQCLKDQDLKGEMSPPVQGQAPREHAIELLIRTSLRLCRGRVSHLISYLTTSGSEREPPEICTARRGQPGLPGRGFGELQPSESVQAQHQPPSASLVPGPHSREMRAFTVCAYLFESHTYIHQPTYFLLSRIPLLFLVEYKIFDYFPKWKSRFPSLTVW